MEKKYVLIDGELCPLDYSIFNKNQNGLVPATNTDENMYLRSDGTWSNPEGTKNYSELENKPSINSVVLSSTTTTSDLGLYAKPVSGIPASDLADGVIPQNMVGSTETNDGKSGLVPTPIAGSEKKYLRGDGAWTEIAIGDVESISTDVINNFFS